MKNKEDSISSFILRLLNREEGKNSIEELAGIFEKNSEEWEAIEKILYEERMRITSFK